MKQLSGSDAIFLVGEQDHVYNHVAMLMIYDVSTAPGGKVRFKDVLSHFEERIYDYPIFRRRLVEAPLKIDRPYWMEDKNIDVEYHVRHLALPEPGDWRQLMIQVARLHSRPLDRGHPLWEAYIIEGLNNIPKLPPGSFAMFMKLHHSAVDGMAGILLAEQIHATSPQIAAPRPGHRIITVDRPLVQAEFVTRALGNGLARLRSLGKLARRTAGLVATLGKEQLAHQLGRAAEPPLSLPPTPETRFSGAVSGHRVAQGFGMPLSRIKRVRAKVPGATLNDIFLAMSGGAVRRYLTSKQELPKDSLVAMVPMSLRSDASAGGNAVGAAMVAVRSDIDGPLERLRAVHDEAAKGKATAEKMGTDLIASVLDVMPSFIGNYVLNNVLIGNLNFTVSNVRGPDRPLYLAGAKAMCLYPISIPTSGAGLNITGVSYNGVMWVSVVSCRTMLPDPDFFLSCMRESWEEILAAADALPGETQAPSPIRPASARKPSAGKQPAAKATAPKTGARSRAKK